MPSEVSESAKTTEGADRRTLWTAGKRLRSIIDARKPKGLRAFAVAEACRTEPALEDQQQAQTAVGEFATLPQEAPEPASRRRHRCRRVDFANNGFDFRVQCR